MKENSLEKRRTLFYPDTLKRNWREKLLLLENEWRFIKEGVGGGQNSAYLKSDWFGNIGRLWNILIQKEYFLMPQIDLVLTTKCSLKCKNCANLMQYYKNPYDVDKNVIKRSVKELLKGIDYLRSVLVLGGEPFVYKDLNNILEFLCRESKIGKVFVVTNGTICPTDESLIHTLQHPKICIRISDYGELSVHKRQLISLCQKRNIQYRLIKQGRWFLPGNVQKRNRTPRELQVHFRRCSTLCRSLLNGRLYYCARGAHLTDLKFAPDKGEYVDLLTKKTGDKRRQEIHEYCSRRKAITVCDYCDIRTAAYEKTKVKPAEQTKEVLEI